MRQESPKGPLPVHREPGLFQPTGLQQHASCVALIFCSTNSGLSRYPQDSRDCPSYRRHFLHDCLFCRQDQLEQIAAKLDGPLVVQKGAKDGISDGKTTVYCEGGGSKRRAGGQVQSPSSLVFV